MAKARKRQMVARYQPLFLNNSFKQLSSGVYRLGLIRIKVIGDFRVIQLESVRMHNIPPQQ